MDRHTNVRTPISVHIGAPINGPGTKAQESLKVKSVETFNTKLNCILFADRALASTLQRFNASTHYVRHILRVISILLEVVLLFNLLIVVHELGHFLAARWRVFI